MGKERPNVDQKSFDLAEYFLVDEPQDSEDEKWELAGVIQQAVEDWIEAQQEPGNG